MQISKKLYIIKFELPRSGSFNAGIEGYLCYAAAPEEVKEAAQELGKTKAQGKKYLGVEHLPYGFVISPRSPYMPATIHVESEERSRDHARKSE